MSGPQIRVYHAYRIDPVDGGVALRKRGQIGLDFDGNDFARKPERSDHHGNSAASGAKLEYSIAPAYPHKTTQQDGVDRKTITLAWLDEGQRAV